MTTEYFSNDVEIQLSEDQRLLSKEEAETITNSIVSDHKSIESWMQKMREAQDNAVTQ